MSTAIAVPTTAPTEIEYKPDPVLGQQPRRNPPVRANYQPISNEPAYTQPPAPRPGNIPPPPPPARTTPVARTAIRSATRPRARISNVGGLGGPMGDAYADAALDLADAIMNLPNVEGFTDGISGFEPFMSNAGAENWQQSDTNLYNEGYQKGKEARDTIGNFKDEVWDTIGDAIEWVGRDIDTGIDSVKFVWDSNRDWAIRKFDDFQIPQIDRPPFPDWQFPKPQWRMPPIRLPRIGNPLPRFDLPPLKQPNPAPYESPEPQPQPDYNPSRRPYRPQKPENCLALGYKMIFGSVYRVNLQDPRFPRELYVGDAPLPLSFSAYEAPYPVIQNLIVGGNKWYWYDQPLTPGSTQYPYTGLTIQVDLGRLDIYRGSDSAENAEEGYSTWRGWFFEWNTNIWNPNEIQKSIYADLSQQTIDVGGTVYYPDGSSSPVPLAGPGFGLIHAYAICVGDRGPAGPPRPPHTRPPRRPRRKPPMSCCNCDSQRAIQNSNLVAIQVPIASCTLYQSDETPDGVWVPEITWQQIKIDKGSAGPFGIMAQSIADQAVAECEGRNTGLAKIAQRLGVDQFPISLPRSIKQVPGGSIQMDINSFPEMWLWWIKQFDSIVGQWPVEISIKDSDPLKAGDQPIELKIPNMAEAIAEIFGLTLSAEISAETAVNIAFRTLAEAGMAKNAAIVSQDLAKANAEFLGYKLDPKTQEVKTAFTPGSKKLSDALQESTQKVRSYENTDDQDLKDMLMPLMEAAAIIRAVHWRKLDGKGNIKDQIKGILQAYLDLAEDKPSGPEDPEAPKQDNWDKFLDDTERGFIDRAGIRDQAQPYGRSYDQRPLIRELGNTADLGD